MKIKEFVENPLLVTAAAVGAYFTVALTYYTAKHGLRRMLHIKSGGRGGNMTFWQFGRWGGSIYRRKRGPVLPRSKLSVSMEQFGSLHGGGTSNN